MDFIIETGQKKHLPEVLELVKDLAEFEKAPLSVTNSVERMNEEYDFFEFFVATLEEKVIGIAIYFFSYSTWVGKSLYLDDLYVEPEFRGNGIASELMDNIFKAAFTANCHRVRWQVLDWNTNAIDIYNKLGADLDGEWINCDFSEAQIKELANKA